jgi:hypothetical protein
MPANKEPVFPLVPEIKRAVIAQGATTTDKTGGTPANLVELVAAATDGTKVTWIKFKHTGTSTAGLYLVFVTDTTGASPRLYAELLIAAVPSSGAALTHEATLSLLDFQLKAGQKILVGATTANTAIHITAATGDY